MTKAVDTLLVELLGVGGLTPSKMCRHSPEYRAYLKSPQWKAKRLQVLDRDHHRCCACGSTENLQIHHHHYDELGHESLDCLATFCKTCHKEVDKLAAEQRRKKHVR